MNNHTCRAKASIIDYIRDFAPYLEKCKLVQKTFVQKAINY